MDDDLIKSQQAAYSIQGVDENVCLATEACRCEANRQVPAAPELAREERKNKRKQGEKEPKPKPVKAQNPSAPLKRTGVWVSNLPPNTTPELLASVFSKAGVLHVGDDGKPRIKLYYDDDGKFKGDALIVYFKEGSVDLAITLLDDTELELGAGYGNMRVRFAEYDKSKTKDQPEETKNGNASGEKKKHLTAEDKHRITKRMRTLERYVQIVLGYSDTSQQACMAL